MTDQHPITPPPELVEQWIAEIWHEGTPVRVAASDIHIATQAARWGADQELEACCEWLDYNCPSVGAHHLRAARRPKPPSLAEEALDAQERMWIGGTTDADWELIRRALERLQKLEGAND